MIVLLLITTLVISFQHARASWTIRQLRFEPAPSSSPFPGEIMAYVTPWNAAGYDNAKKMAKKLDWVSPVWFQIRFSTDLNLEIHGTHDVDLEWIKQLRTASTASTDRFTCSSTGCGLVEDGSSRILRLVPRVVLEANISPERVKKASKSVAKQLIEISKKYDLDGFTLEISFQQYSFLAALCRQLKKDQSKEIKIILPVPPYSIIEDHNSHEYKTTQKVLRYVSTLVDRFSVMTYDYPRREPTLWRNESESSSKEHQTIPYFPNAPLNWCEETIEFFLEMTYDPEKPFENKLLMGVPLYGWSMPSQEALTGNSFIDRVLKANSNSFPEEDVVVPWIYDNATAEHFAILPGKFDVPEKVSYPSPQFIRERLKLAGKVKRKWKNHTLAKGVAFWELGQMLPAHLAVI